MSSCSDLTTLRKGTTSFSGFISHVSDRTRTLSGDKVFYISFIDSSHNTCLLALTHNIKDTLCIIALSPSCAFRCDSVSVISIQPSRSKIYAVSTMWTRISAVECDVLHELELWTEDTISRASGKVPLFAFEFPSAPLQWVKKSHRLCTTIQLGNTVVNLYASLTLSDETLSPCRGLYVALSNVSASSPGGMSFVQSTWASCICSSSVRRHCNLIPPPEIVSDVPVYVQQRRWGITAEDARNLVSSRGVCASRRRGVRTMCRIVSVHDAHVVVKNTEYNDSPVEVFSLRDIRTL